MKVDQESPAYHHWAGYVTELVRDAAHEHPIPDDNLWELIAYLDWPANGPDAARVAARLLALAPARQTASRLGLLGQTAVAVYDKRNEVEMLLDENAGERLVGAIPSEDGLDDFCFHLVGMGKEFYEGLASDPEPALELAERGDYYESLRYVFQAAVEQLPYAEVVRGLRDMFEVATLADAATVEAGSLIALGDDLLGIVARRDRDSILVITPDGERTLPSTGL